MSGAYAQINWGGTVPGADSNTYVLWASCVPGTTQTDRVIQNANRDGACGARMFAEYGLHKFTITLKNSQAGTLNTYYSPDRGTTWLQLTTDAVAIPGAGTASRFEWIVEAYPDWKVEWVNGGVAQATWSPAMVLTDQRAT